MDHSGSPFLKSLSDAISLLGSHLFLCPSFYMEAEVVIVVKIGFIVHILRLVRVTFRPPRVI